MNTKIKLAIAASVLLFSSSIDISPASAAAVKAGTACTKPGQIKQSGSSTFVCAKVGKKSVWVQAGSDSSSASTPAPAAAPTCTTGIGTRLANEIVRSPEGLGQLQIKNPTNCTVSYSIVGQMTCIHYKNARDVINATGNGTLRPMQTVVLNPSQVSQTAYLTCQQLQKASGAGPEYGAGILSFNNPSNLGLFTYSVSIIGISN